MASERLGNIEDLSYKDDISLFSQIVEYSQMQPFKLKFFVLLVCLNGHGSLNINGVDYRVDAGKMFVCKPYIIVEKCSVSLDFECRGMALSSKFIDQLGRVADGGWDLEMFLGKNPVLSLSEDEISLFMQYYALLGSKITHSSCRHQDAVMQASEVINRCIIDDVRRLLHNSDKSVKEISNELGFPNLSFFGKYVKRMLGMSPKAYRKSLGVIAGE